MLPFFPLLMVAAFCATTVYAELRPRRFAELFNSPPSSPRDEALFRGERDKLAERARRRRLRRGAR